MCARSLCFAIAFLWTDHGRNGCGWNRDLSEGHNDDSDDFPFITPTGCIVLLAAVSMDPCSTFLVVRRVTDADTLRCIVTEVIEILDLTCLYESPIYTRC
jgi:hypothetical protein